MDPILEQRLREAYGPAGTPDPARDRVKASVLQAARQIPQERPGRLRRWWLGAGREPRPAPLMATAATIALVVLVVGLFALVSLTGDQEMEPGPSPSTSPRPTVVPSFEQVETSLATVEPAFVAETVALGVERIVADGAGYDERQRAPGESLVFEDIDVAANGDIWVVAHRQSDDRSQVGGVFAFELGSAGEYGFGDGFPSFPVKLIVDIDSDPVVASADTIHRFDGERWVPSTGSHTASDFDGTTRFVPPESVDSLGEAGVLDPGTEAVLIMLSDGLGYTLGADIGRHLWRQGGSWWEVCGPGEGIQVRTGSGCRTREQADERGLGLAHPDGSTALYLADQKVRRIARAPDQAVWVIAGPTIEEVRAGATGSGAIYRIDPAAPGFSCEGC
jgi:hypothetical protein